MKIPPPRPHPALRSRPAPVGDARLPSSARVRLRRVGALLLAGALTASVGACALKVGEGSSVVLPQASTAEASRDAMARAATLIGSTAQVVATTSTDQTVVPTSASIQEEARQQVEALGGVWEPWATPVPTTYPTATPVATAAPDATVSDLVTALSSGVETARGVLETAEPAQAQLAASLVVSWSTRLEELSPGSVAPAPRDAATMSEPLGADLLLAYDSARYAMEEVAARSAGADRERAQADGAVADQVVRASVALGGTDSRLAAYAAPTASSDAQGLDATWALQVELGVMTAEISTVGSASGAARTSAVDAAVDAAGRARAWGATLPALPAYQG